MADKDEATTTKPSSRNNSIAIDDKDRRKQAGSKAPAPALDAGVPVIGETRDTGKAPRTPSVEAGDLPDAVRKRYYADKAKWSGDPAYFTSAEMKDPAFRDQGRRLVTATESQEVVKDLVAIAQHRGWEKVHVTGTEAFRRSVWLEASQKGLDVRGYKPNDRDLQELDRFRSDASKNTISPMSSRDVSESRDPATAPKTKSRDDAGSQDRQLKDGRATPNDRAADSQMRVMEAVIRRTLFDNREAVSRVMTVARAQLDAHIAAGRTIRPAVVRDTGTSVQRGMDRDAQRARETPVRQGRDHKAPDRNRSR